MVRVCSLAGFSHGRVQLRMRALPALLLARAAGAPCAPSAEHHHRVQRGPRGVSSWLVSRAGMPTAQTLMGSWASSWGGTRARCRPALRVMVLHLHSVGAAGEVGAQVGGGRAGR